MKESAPMSTEPAEYGDTVTPVKSRETRGKVYEDTFTHGDVHIEDGCLDALSEKAEKGRQGDRVFYKYGTKPPVMVTEEGVHRHGGSPVQEVREQAYFVLSMLAAEGYVSNWRKK